MDKILYKNKELFSPKLDIVFKALFGTEDGKDILLYFLNSVLDLNIKSTKDITLTNTEIVPESSDGKLSRLDVCAIVKSDNNEHIDIEIQLSDNDNMMKRSVYYVAKLFSGQLEKSEVYDELGVAIGLSILDFNIFDDARWMHRGRLKDIETHNEFTNCFEVNFVEMKKLPKDISSVKDKKELWLMFLNAKTEEDINMLVKQNAEIGVAVDKLERISSNAKFQHQALMREKAERDYNSSISYAENKGREEEKLTVAKNLLLNHIDINIIASSTGLSKEEIEKIKKEL